MYGFSDFVCSLNEMEEGVAPTDSRLRPDQRIMENGDFDGANADKVKLSMSQSILILVWSYICHQIVAQYTE